MEDLKAGGGEPAVLYYDVVSPWACLMFRTLQREPLPVALELRPIVFAAVLNAVGNKGPAEIERKRILTYELCTWTAQTRGIPFQMPAAHPFNPLRYLRLILALGGGAEVVSAVFATVFETGLDPESEAAWQDLHVRLGRVVGSVDIAAYEVKQQLHAHTAEAVQRGLFGVPTVMVGERLFWGLECLPLLRAWLAGDPRVATPEMQAARQVRLGSTRVPPTRAA